MKSTIATIMVLTFASSVEAKWKPKVPMVKCRYQAGDDTSTFKGALKFKTKIDKETSEETVGMCTGIRGLTYDDGEDADNDYISELYPTFVEDT